MDQNNNLPKRGIFSPVKGNILSMIFTFIYFLILSWSIVFMRAYLFYRFELKNAFLSSLDLIEGGFLFIILLPAVITFIIHKKTWKGVLVLIGLLISYIIFMFIILTPEEEGYLMLAMFGIVPFLFAVTFISILFRGLFKLKLWMRFLIALAPFVIILLIVLTTAMQTKNVDVDYCEGLGQISTQIDCYHNLALKENDPSICMRIEGADNIKQYCPLEIFFKLDKTNSIPSSACTNLQGYDNELCFTALGIVKKDSSICDNIGSDYNKHRCYSGIVWNGGDSSLCDKILNNAGKKSCLNPQNKGYYDNLKE
tara:strand:- start:241 stop:1173 length:933 start_codon:yes stop_codon:yes gene_type:complete